MDDFVEPRFVPAPDLIAWATDTFIRKDSPLHNPDHAHLEYATLGVLWTNVANARNGRAIVGQCEMGMPRGTMGRWSRARAERQILDWFGSVPDFILTFDASYAMQAKDPEFCALIEHELYHAGQDRDPFGAPKFTQDGRPVFGIRGHDIEEFIGVVARYGANASGVQEMVKAAKQRAQIAEVRISQACGTCSLKAA